VRKTATRPVMKTTDLLECRWNDGFPHKPFDGVREPILGFINIHWARINELGFGANISMSNENVDAEIQFTCLLPTDTDIEYPIKTMIHHEGKDIEQNKDCHNI
jgi:hypothetical protein